MPHPTRSTDIPRWLFERGMSIIVASMITLSLVSCSSTKPAPAPMTTAAPAPNSFATLDISNLNLDGWHELRSPDFVIFGQSSREEMERFALDLARYISVVERLVESEPPKSPAYIFLVDDDVEDLLVQSDFSLAYMTSSLTGIDLVIRDGSVYDPVKRSIFLHEFTHYLTLRNRKLMYPAWYEEGFAEFLSSTRKRGNTMEIGSAPGRVRELGFLQAIKWKLGGAKYPFDLKPALAWKRSSLTQYPIIFYGTSWITVHYLNSNPDRQKQLATMIRLQGQGVEWEEAFSRAFPESIDELERKINRHGEQLVHGTPAAILYLPLEVLDIRTEWTMREIPSPEVMRILAGFALRGSTTRSAGYSVRIAEAFYRQALAADATDSESIAGLAVTLAKQDRFSEARAQLEALDAIADPSVPALVLAGHTLEYASSLQGDDHANERMKLFEASIRYYQRALELDPSNPSALAGLGRSQLETGRLDAARVSLARALEWGEWDADVTLARARVEKKAGSLDRAHQFGQEVLRLGGDQYKDQVDALFEESPAPEDDATNDPGDLD
jgi:tetratricopeptide (TPR) repeat protein